MGTGVCLQAFRLVHDDMEQGFLKWASLQTQRCFWWSRDQWVIKTMNHTTLSTLTMMGQQIPVLSALVALCLG